VGLWILVILARPFTPLRGVLVGIMVALFGLALTVDSVRTFYAFDLPSKSVMLEALSVAFGALVLLEVGWQMSLRLGRGPAAAVRADTPAAVTASRGA
jgi:cation-transporting ATPase E